MLIINNHVIHAFDPQSVLTCCLKTCEYQNYNYLFRAVRRSRLGAYNEKLVIGDDFKTTTNEFNKYEPNVLIFLEEDGKQYFQMIMHNEVYADVTDPNCFMMESFFEQKHFSVIDNYGKELNIKSHIELTDFINMTNAIRNDFENNKELYHDYMRKLTSWREYRDAMPNENVGKTFDDLISLADEYGKQLRDILTSSLGSLEDELTNRYYCKIPYDAKFSYIFGLYIAVLKSYIVNQCNDYTEPVSLEERIFFGFLKEFNYFLQMHKNIVDQYSKFMELRPSEARSIVVLLKQEKLDGTKWDYDSSNLNI